MRPAWQSPLTCVPAAPSLCLEDRPRPSSCRVSVSWGPRNDSTRPQGDHLREHPRGGCPFVGSLGWLWFCRGGCLACSVCLAWACSPGDPKSSKEPAPQRAQGQPPPSLLARRGGKSWGRAPHSRGGPCKAECGWGQLLPEIRFSGLSPDTVLSSVPASALPRAPGRGLPVRPLQPPGQVRRQAAQSLRAVLGTGCQ